MTEYAEYIPYSRRRLSDISPQSHPELFSDADIMKEVKMLIRMNTKYGSHPLRTIAYTKLEQFIRDRRTKGQ